MLATLQRLVGSSRASPFRPLETSHPGIREAAAGVEGRQQSVSQLFGHVQELVLVPQHALSSLLQHDGHGVAPQQAPEHTRHTHTQQSDVS